MKFATTLLTTLLLATVARAQLQLYKAGPLAEPVQELSGNVTICPADYPTGFSIGCTGVESDTQAAFFIDGKWRRKDTVAPFLLLGSIPNKVKPWMSYGRSAEVLCRLPSGTFTANIVFLCDNAPASTMFFESVGGEVITKVLVRPRMTICPRIDLGTDAFTVSCAGGETTTRSFFRINSAQVSVDKEAPFYIAGDEDGIANAWTTAPNTSFTLVCAQPGGIKSQARRVRIECPELPPAEETGCVVLDATKTELSPAWTLDPAPGVTFNADNRSKELAKSGEAPLYYKFTPKITSQYSFILDMTTRGRADYNDVYMRVNPGGLQLRRGDSVGNRLGWIKGYHAFFSRGVKVSSQIDHVPHSVSTGIILQKDVEYEVGISGRSNRVTLHNIVMFPCEGIECQRKYWKKKQEECLPGSTAYKPKPKRVLA